MCSRLNYGTERLETAKVQNCVYAEKGTQVFAACARGWDCTPLVVESQGRQSKSSHALLNELRKENHLASDSGRMAKCSRVMGALFRLSAAPCKRNDFIFSSSLHFFCCTAGKYPAWGAAVPMALHPCGIARNNIRHINSAIVGPNDTSL